jgi:hypothetical protein
MHAAEPKEDYQQWLIGTQALCLPQAALVRQFVKDSLLRNGIIDSDYESCVGIIHFRAPVVVLKAVEDSVQRTSYSDGHGKSPSGGSGKR